MPRLTPSRNRIAARAFAVAACALLGAIAAKPARAVPESAPQIIYSPMPPYPAVAASHRWDVQGAFLLNFDSNGKVTQVQMSRSTGHAVLDTLAIETLKRWRFRPGAAGREWVPITFWPPMGGSAADVPFVVSAGPNFKEKFHLRFDPFPEYPLMDQAQELVGAGVFRLNFKPNGKVASVTVIHSTGYFTLDRAAERTLLRWTTVPGAFTNLSMPIRFLLGHYASAAPSRR